MKRANPRQIFNIISKLTNLRRVLLKVALNRKCSLSAQKNEFSKKELTSEVTF